MLLWKLKYKRSLHIYQFIPLQTMFQDRLVSLEAHFGLEKLAMLTHILSVTIHPIHLSLLARHSCQTTSILQVAHLHHNSHLLIRHQKRLAQIGRGSRRSFWAWASWSLTSKSSLMKVLQSLAGCALAVHHILSHSFLFSKSPVNSCSSSTP